MTQQNQTDVKVKLSLNDLSNQKIFAKIVYDQLYGESAVFNAIVQFCKMTELIDQSRISRIGDKCLFAIQNGYSKIALIFCDELFRLGKKTSRSARFIYHKSQIFPGIPEDFKKHDLIDDVQALIDEGFEDIIYNTTNHILSAVTEEIIIQDVNLGKFRINYHFAKSDNSAYCTVDAINPTYSLGAISHTGNPHPHITNGNALCYGNMSDPIHESLLHDRLSDFFLITRAVLSPQGYCGDGSYVRIESWYQRPCYECGRFHNQNDLVSCYMCKESDDRERFLCPSSSSCSLVCHCCNKTTCSSHAAKCYTCGKYVCRNCRVSCQNCGYNFCPDCIMAESKHCKHCLVEIFERMINEKTRIQETQAAEQCGAGSPDANKKTKYSRRSISISNTLSDPTNNYINFKNPFEEIDSSYSYDFNKFFK